MDTTTILADLLLIAIALATVIVFHKWALARWVLVGIALCSSRYGVTLAGATLHPEQVAEFLLVARIIGKPPKSISRGPFGIAALVFLLLWLTVLTTSSLLYALKPFASLYIVAWIATSVFGAVVVFVYYGSERASILAGITISLTTASVASIVNWLLLERGQSIAVFAQQTAGDSTYRTSALMYEPNIFGSFCAMWLIVILTSRARLSRRYGIAASVIAIGAILTLTRAVWVALALSAAILLWNAGLKTKLVSALVAAVALGTLFASDITAVVAPILPADVLDRIENLDNFSSGNGAFRASAYRIAVADLATRNAWLHGFGANSFTQQHEFLVHAALTDYLSNAWLAQIYDGGLAALLFIVVGILCTIAASRTRAHAVLLVIVIVLCASITNPLWFLYPWLCLSLVAGGKDRNEKAIAPGDVLHPPTERALNPVHPRSPELQRG